MADLYTPPAFDRSGISKSVSNGIPSEQTVLPKSRDKTESFTISELVKKKPEKENHSNFDSTKFNKVGSLLTNVEDYSKKIREDVNREKRHAMENLNVLKSECQLELTQALIVKKEAQEIAGKLIREAENSRDRLVEEAKKEGFGAGLAEGRKKFKEENERNTHGILQLLTELRSARLDILHQYEKQIVQLSLLIAKKVIHSQVKSDPRFVANMVKEAVARFEGVDDIKIAVNPVEFDFMMEYQPEIAEFLNEEQNVKLKKDPNVKPAAAFIESSFAAVDLDLEVQLKEIDSHLKECVEERRQILSRK